VAREGSFSEGMPLQNERGDVTLVFSGEEFPEPGTIEALRAVGHDVVPDGPSYLVHRYEEEPDFPKRLNGRFHGLVVDGARGTVTLFNDRYGLQRIYYHESKTLFTLRQRQRQSSKCALSCADRSARDRGVHRLRLCAREPDTLFGHSCSTSWVGLSFRGGVLEKKAPYFGRGNGKRKSRSSQKNTTPNCATFSCASCPLF